MFDEKETRIVSELHDSVIECMQQLKSYYEEQMLALREQVDELQQYSDVSVVKSLTVKNADLQTELNVLKRRYQLLETQSARGNASQRDAKSKPMIKPKKRDADVQPEQENEQQERERMERMKAEQAEQQEQQERERMKAEQEQQERERMKAEAEQKAQEHERMERMKAEQAEQEQHEDEGELLLVKLVSGQYYLDSTTCELYEFIDESTPGEIVGKLKIAAIRRVPHYIDSIDNNIYVRLDDGGVGEHVGSRVNGRAVLNKKR